MCVCVCACVRVCVSVFPVKTITIGLNVTLPLSLAHLGIVYAIFTVQGHRSKFMVTRRKMLLAKVVGLVLVDGVYGRQAV